MKLETCDISMLQSLALVKMYEPRKRTESQVVLDDEKNVGKDPTKDEMERKTVKTKVMYNIQTVEILAIDPTNNCKLEVGDIVVVDFRNLREFDLFKGVYIIQVYSIFGKVNQGPLS
jgi:hypothetical protein